MKLVLLTDENGNAFYLNIDLIETISERKFRGGSVIYLTTGKWIECLEEKGTIAAKVNFISYETDKE